MKEDALRCYLLIGHLPRSSRLYEDSLGGPAFTHTDSIIASIERAIQTYFWAHSKDGKNGVNPPELMLPQHIQDIVDASERRNNAETVAELGLGDAFGEELRFWINGGDFK